MGERILDFASLVHSGECECYLATIGDAAPGVTEKIRFRLPGMLGCIIVGSNGYMQTVGTHTSSSPLQPLYPTATKQKIGFLFNQMRSKGDNAEDQDDGRIMSLFPVSGVDAAEKVVERSHGAPEDRNLLELLHH